MPPSSDARVTVVVAVHNMERTIGRCLESLVKADRLNTEIVVVDDGSTDSTPQIIGRYPVRVIRIENSGVSAARNAAIAASSGDIVAFTDGDCYVDRDWVKKLVRWFDNPRVGGVGGLVDFEKRGIVATALSLEYEKRFALRSRATQSLACINAAFRRDALLSVRGFKRLAAQMVGGEDIDLSYRIAEAGWSLAYDPTIVVVHDGLEMRRKIIKRNFRNAAVSVAIFRSHRRAWKDPFFNWSLKAQPIAFGLCILGAAFAGFWGLSWWYLLLLLPAAWHVPIAITTARHSRNPLALFIVPAVFLLRSGAFLVGAFWGAIRLRLDGKAAAERLA